VLDSQRAHRDEAVFDLAQCLLDRGDVRVERLIGAGRLGERLGLELAAVENRLEDVGGDVPGLGLVGVEVGLLGGDDVRPQQQQIGRKPGRYLCVIKIRPPATCCREAITSRCREGDADEAADIAWSDLGRSPELLGAGGGIPSESRERNPCLPSSNSGAVLAAT
jgi:hypothetical protein